MGHDHHHHRRRDRADEAMGEASSEGRALCVRATLENDQVADHLLALARTLRAGGGTLRGGGQTVVLRVGEAVELEVRAGEEGARSVVRLALRWRTPIPQADLEITPGIDALATPPVDPTTQAHAVGLVLPGDPPSASGTPPRAPVSTATPGVRRGPRGRQGADEQPPEA